MVSYRVWCRNGENLYNYPKEWRDLGVSKQSNKGDEQRNNG